MSHTYDRISKHVLASKRDVEQRLANHDRKCAEGIIGVQLDIAVSNLNVALDRIEAKDGR